NEVAAVVSQPVIHYAYPPISDPAEEVALVGVPRGLGDLEAGIRRIAAHHSAEFAAASSIRRKIERKACIVMSKAGRLQIDGQIVKTVQVQSGDLEASRRLDRELLLPRGRSTKSGFDNTSCTVAPHHLELYVPLSFNPADKRIGPGPVHHQ